LDGIDDYCDGGVADGGKKEADDLGVGGGAGMGGVVVETDGSSDLVVLRMCEV
jgi:hypothetical protein